jgi:hypothetical protein
LPRGLVRAAHSKILVVRPPGTPWQAGWARRYFSCSTRETDSLTVFLECHNAVNTIGAEDAELAFVITAEVDEAATTLTSAG